MVYLLFSNIYVYPPTRALAKAGAAPGTTAGVELLLLSFPRSNPSRSQQRCPRATSRKHSPGMLHPAVKTSRHLDMKITCFGQVSFPAEGFVFQGQSSRSRIPVVKVQVIDSDEDGGVRPLPSVRAPNARGRLRRLKLCKAFCTGFNVQGAGQHLASMSCTHMGAHIWAMVAELVGGGLPACGVALVAQAIALPQGHTSMASYGRPSLPFASPYCKPLKRLKTLKTLKTLTGRPSLPFASP